MHDTCLLLSRQAVARRVVAVSACQESSVSHKVLTDVMFVVTCKTASLSVVTRFSKAVLVFASQRTSTQNIQVREASLHCFTHYLLINFHQQ